MSEHPRYVESTSAYSTDDFEGELSEVLCCAANNYWKGKGVKVNGPPLIKRMCFNYGKENHLARDCPYERRETQGGQLILKKSKFVPRAFVKRAPQKALVITKHEEYESGGEEEDDDTSEEVGMAALAMGKLPPSLAPLFSTPHDNKVSKPMCLMAKDSKVNHPPKNTISCKPSLLDCVEGAGKNEEKEYPVTHFINKLLGPTKKMVEALMYKYGEVKKSP